jgi:hypothetical protein
MDPRQQQASTYTGVIFGLSLSGPLLLYGVLDKYWKALGLILLTAVAYPCSVFAAMGLELKFPQIIPENEQWNMSRSDPSSPALFVGGLVGGLIVFSAVAFFCRRRIAQTDVIPMALLGIPLGGILALLARIIHSSLGIALQYALYVTWQTGMAAAIGIMLRLATVVRDHAGTAPSGG